MRRYTVLKQLALMGLLIGTLSGGTWAAVSPGAVHYLPDAMIDGRQIVRWNDDTRVIMVNIRSGSRVSGWHPEMVQLLKAACAEWQQAMAGRLRFEYTADSEQADITVNWQRLSQGERVGEQVSGWTNNTFTDADIVISLTNPVGRPLSSPELMHVALHEVGHALGIKGHSANPKDIMYPNVQPGVVHLSSRDISTMRLLYQQKPTITNPVGIHLVQYKHYLYYMRLASGATKEKRTETAYAYFQKARSYYPKSPDIAFFLGLSALNTKRYDVAITQLQAALTASPLHQADARYFLACALWASAANDDQQGRRNNAQEKLKLARANYLAVLKHPQTSSDMRRLASSSLNQLSSQIR